MASGTVKSFFGNRGFGFIILPDGREVFAHFSQIQVDLYESTKGLEAKNIFRL